MFKKWIAALAGLAVILSAGCMEMTSTTTVKKDGSGTITAKMLMGPQMAQMAAMNTGDDGKPVDMLADLRKELENPSQYGEGVKLVGIKDAKNEAGWTGLEATYSFTDVTKLKLGGKKDGEEGGGGPMMEGPEYKIAFTKGATCKLVMTPEKRDPPAELTAEEKEAEAAAEAQSEQMAGMMAPMLAGMKMQMFLKVDGKVTSTNVDAGNKLDDGILVMEVLMDQVIKDPKNLGKLEKAAKKGEKIEIPGVKMLDPTKEVVVECK